MSEAEAIAVPASAPFWVTCVAASIGGVFSDLAVFPLDTVRARQMATTRGAGESLATILRTSSVRSLFRGCGAVAAASGPAHVLYFGAYDFVGMLRFERRVASSGEERERGVLTRGAPTLPGCD